MQDVKTADHEGSSDKKSPKKKEKKKGSDEGDAKGLGSQQAAVVAALGANIILDPASVIPAAERLAATGDAMAARLVLLSLTAAVTYASGTAGAAAPAGAIVRICLGSLKEPLGSGRDDSGLEGTMAPLEHGLPAEGSQAALVRQPASAAAASARGCLKVALEAIRPGKWAEIEDPSASATVRTPHAASSAFPHPFSISETDSACLRLIPLHEGLWYLNIGGMCFCVLLVLQLLGRLLNALSKNGCPADSPSLKLVSSCLSAAVPAEERVAWAANAAAAPAGTGKHALVQSAQARPLSAPPQHPHCSSALVLLSLGRPLLNPGLLLPAPTPLTP